ncbi:hypothetical protein HN51_046415 [Arachis hypogaea]|uniref:Auxin-induced protein n=1 Tax=Arachis hypogaea TaxID=3818 RepID=A0A445ACQ4_ARAHY|nr:auxin-responsive protein SAUR32-like [Arachis ipaensis]QHO22561.1 Auxin-responsive protein [Arachis hypogaea]RYR24135.1 hypothetical protein Ahy_B02g057634 [Arachis hypogaea]
MLGSEEKKVDHDHQRKKVINNKDAIIPKGYLPIKVGHGEEQEKIVMPVMYLNHPLFSQLLKEAEEEYGFDQQGTIIIPCHLKEFRYIQELIDRDNNNNSNNNNKSLQHHHHNHFGGCFKGSSSQQDQV